MIRTIDICHLMIVLTDSLHMFGFNDNCKLCSDADVCVCTYVCVLWRPACKHDISRMEAWTDLIFGM